MRSKQETKKQVPDFNVLRIPFHHRPQMLSVMFSCGTRKSTRERKIGEEVMDRKNEREQRLYNRTGMESSVY